MMNVNGRVGHTRPTDKQQIQQLQPSTSCHSIKMKTTLFHEQHVSNMWNFTDQCLTG